MSFDKKKSDKRGIINQVLLDIPKISQAPRSIAEFPGFWECEPGKEIDDFEDRCHAQEEGKLYKAVDEEGNIYLMQNPWLSERQRVGYRPKPVLKFTYDEAISEAALGRQKALPAPTKMLPTNNTEDLFE